MSSFLPKREAEGHFLAEAHCELYETTVNSTQNTFSFVKNKILMKALKTVLKYIVANHTKKSYLQMAVKITRSGP